MNDDLYPLEANEVSDLKGIAKKIMHQPGISKRILQQNVNFLVFKAQPEISPKQASWWLNNCLRSDINAPDWLVEMCLEDGSE